MDLVFDVACEANCSLYVTMLHVESYPHFSMGDLVLVVQAWAVAIK